MFRKDEHPRESNGKFTDKGAGAGEGEKLRKAVSIYSDEPDKDAPPQKVPEPATGFNRLETKHHQRHAREMGFKNTRENEKAAVEFFNENVIPFPFCAVFNHVLKIGAVVVRACHGSVNIGVENKYTFPVLSYLNPYSLYFPI